MSTWILLRGLSRESRHWGVFPEIFRREFVRTKADDDLPVLPTPTDLTILTPDLPGNGRRNREGSPLRVEDMAEMLRAELAAQGMSPPYHLLAMSLGAMVAVAWAQRHPEEISAAVLINTSLRPFNPFYQRLRPHNYLRLLSLMTVGGSDLDWENTIYELTSRRPEQRAETVRHWLALRQQNPVSKRNVLRQLVAAARFRAPPQRPQVPLLILGSARDALVDSACSRQLSRQWGTAYAEHRDAGHDLPLDEGQWVAHTVVDWLATLGNTSMERGTRPAAAMQR